MEHIWLPIVIISIVIIYVIVFKYMSHLQQKLYDNVFNPNAKLQSKAMVRIGIISAPGVVQIVDDQIKVYMLSLFGDPETLQYPLNDIKVIKSFVSISKAEWIGKTCFRIQTPNKETFGFGVSKPAAWKKELCGIGY